MGIIWEKVTGAFGQRFISPHPGAEFRLLLFIVLAATLGGLLGGAAMGMRGVQHCAFFALGTAVFMLIPQQHGETVSLHAPIVMGIVVGIAVMGAALVVPGRLRSGCRWAAATGVWLSGAVGVGVGLGACLMTGVGCVVACLGLILWRRCLARDCDHS